MIRSNMSVFLSLTVGIAAVSAVLAAPANAVETGMSMQRACDAQYGAGFISRPLDEKNAYSWRCTRTGVANGIDVARACREQYTPRATAVVLDRGNAYSWRCRF